MRKQLYLLGLLGLLGLGGTSALGQNLAAFGSTTTKGLPVVVTIPIFSGGLISMMGSVDYNGPVARLTGTTVINGDLRLRNGSAVTVGATGTLYVYGNLFTQQGTLTVESGGHVYFYGNQWSATPTASIAGTGTVHVISPRPATGAAADGQQRPAALDGLAAGAATQYLDGGGAPIGADLELRSAAGVTLADLNSDGAGDLSISGTLTLATDDAPLVLGANNLVLDQQPAGAVGQIAGYSERRYAQTSGGGTVRVAGLPAGASFTFPVGAAATGDYTPARLTNQAGAAVTLSLAALVTPPVAAGSPTAGRYWQVASSNAAAPFDLLLEHNLTTNQPGYNNSQASIIRSDGSTWEMAGSGGAGTSTGALTTGAAIAGASDLGRALVAAASTPAYFTKATAVPLPVQLVAFEAKRGTASAVALSWRTASELNNAGFEVQRSLDGRTWAKVGFVAGHGSTTMANSYAYTDYASTAVYYRLLQIDTNGQQAYSPVRTVPALAAVAGLVAYPNPARGTVNVTGHDVTLAVDVCNTLGQVVQQIRGGNFSTLGLAPGVYVLRQGSLATRLVVE